MSPKLKPLLLPQLVEERRKRESISDSEMDLSASFTHTSSTSEATSPVTPTFSARHLRYPSSASSIESTYHASVTESPSSPSFVAKPNKRSLPDVIEEIHEREDDFDMLHDAGALYDCLCKYFDSACLCMANRRLGDNQHCAHRSPARLPARQEYDYDLADGFFSDDDFPVVKRRRAAESPLTGLATRFGTKFPSFSRRWRLRREEYPSSINHDAQRDIATAPGASSRSSSMSRSTRQAMDTSLEPQLTPTPARSVYNSREDLIPVTPIDIEKANASDSEREERLATTPLLPPLMTDASANSRVIHLQSPLQSPSVAEPSDDSVFEAAPPIDPINSQLAGLPSPPLSTKPSISSFHRNNLNWSGHLTPSSEIPGIVIADPDDEWANKLGHANFSIYPEPYIPDTFDLEGCRQLRANWDLARCNYTKHLVRTGEHYGATSKTYKLTEEKWAIIDAHWRKNNDLTIKNTSESSSDAFARLKHTTLSDGSRNIMTKIPSLNDPRSGGKFPQLGDEDIVGPMVQVAAQLRCSPSKKTKLFRFLTEKFPGGLGKF
jgi:hypothetical protein